MNTPAAPESQPVSGYLEILQNLFTALELSHADVAKRLGWDSPSTVGNKLRGERRTQISELEAMAKVAGITLVQLAAMSDDLVLTKYEESSQGAALIDELPEDQRKLALEILRNLRPVTPGSQG